ncbi:MAG TPA: ribonuclease P protein component [Candidatus Saccharimonadia bacterium]|nr:ribonuclease P protein component [Candidatus Saccharimonadia bacterium]
MIKKINRFHGYGSLRFTYRRGLTVRGPLCSVKYTKNLKKKTYRLAVVVNKKVNKSAVVRNKIRRVVYENIRSFEKDIKSPHDIVVTIYSDQILELPKAELDTMLRSQFHQAKLI